MDFYYILYWSFFASTIGELLPLKQKKNHNDDLVRNFYSYRRITLANWG